MTDAEEIETPTVDRLELNLMDQDDDHEANWSSLLKTEPDTALEEAFPSR